MQRTYHDGRERAALYLPRHLVEHGLVGRGAAAPVLAHLLLERDLELHVLPRHVHHAHGRHARRAPVPRVHFLQGLFLLLLGGREERHLHRHHLGLRHGQRRGLADVQVGGGVAPQIEKGQAVEDGPDHRQPQDGVGDAAICIGIQVQHFIPVRDTGAGIGGRAAVVRPVPEFVDGQGLHT